jgi:hypothetical protein
MNDSTQGKKQKEAQYKWPIICKPAVSWAIPFIFEVGKTGLPPLMNPGRKNKKANLQKFTKSRDLYFRASQAPAKNEKAFDNSTRFSQEGHHFMPPLAFPIFQAACPQKTKSTFWRIRTWRANGGRKKAA